MLKDLVSYLAKLIYDKIYIIPAHYGIKQGSLYECTINSLHFLKKFSLPCTIPKLASEATDKYKRDIFGKYANDEDASDIDGGDRT